MTSLVLLLSSQENTPKTLLLNGGVYREQVKHLYGEPDLISILEMLKETCRDYIFIQGPNFDYDGKLKKKSLQWSHTCYDDHTYKFTTLQLSKALEKVGLKRYIYWRRGSCIIIK